jgi:hypothetical protein
VEYADGSRTCGRWNVRVAAGHWLSVASPLSVECRSASVDELQDDIGGGGMRLLSAWIWMGYMPWFPALQNEA